MKSFPTDKADFQNQREYIIYSLANFYKESIMLQIVKKKKKEEEAPKILKIFAFYRLVV